MKLGKIGMGLTISALVIAAAAGTAACTSSADDDSQNSEAEADQKKDTSEETLEGADYTVDMSNIETGKLSPGVVVHDPSIVKADGTYYIFGSHMAAASTEDLISWFGMAGGYSESNAVYTDLANQNSQAFAFTGSDTSVIPNEDGGYAEWAPDVKYNEKLGKYVMYYCTNSNFYSGTICWATSDTIDGAYTWQGNLLYSGFDSSNVNQTNVLDVVDMDYVNENYLDTNGAYKWHTYPHAIDPTIFWDEDDRMWMVYGSWSGGIYLLEIDEATGEVIYPEADPDNGVDPYFGKKLLGGNHTSIEGPYILYDEEAGYYYLYVSYGALTANGGYQIRVFRSDKPDGEYVDMNGQKPDLDTSDHSNFGLKLSGNYNLPSLNKAYKATGHNSAMIDDDGKRYICYHTRFESDGETHSPRVKQYFLNEEGWPCMLPYATAGETISDSGYQEDSVVGRYYVVDQGTDISSTVSQPYILYLTEEGKVFGDKITGTWEMKDGTPYVHIVCSNRLMGTEVEYSGVFCQMKDEAGTEVMTFTAVGANESLWGVKYNE